jgi:thiol-disulfide isomerase/thioredoxin
MISNQYHRERDPSQSAEYYPVTHYRFTPATPAVSEPLSRYCARLAEELLLKEKLILMEWYYRRNTAQDSSFMPRLVAAVQKNYTGYTKEKMLAILFSESFYSSDTTDQLLNNAVNTARDTAMKEILRNIALVKMRGRPVLGFALPDSRGRTVKLSDFHGKIVIIDFWFTGCTTCVQLNRDMNKVVEHYKRDTGVVFISISADTDRKRWMQSLAGGKYTHASSVNLFTEGKGTEHPLLRYYNYLGFPRLMVVSGKGTLVTAHAPTPSDEEEMKKFISLVDGAER